METTAENVAQDKIFRGKLSFVGKQIDEKSRFGGLFTEEIQEIEENGVQVATKKATNFGMRLFSGTYQLGIP